MFSVFLTACFSARERQTDFLPFLIIESRVWHTVGEASKPIEHSQALNTEPDVLRMRRPLSPDEFVKLVDSAYSGLTIQCMTGPDRAMLYIMAAWTGFRRGELASLTDKSFNFEIDPPTVTCSAGYSKRSRKDVIPLHPIARHSDVNLTLGVYTHIPLGEQLEPTGSLNSHNPMPDKNLDTACQCLAGGGQK